MKIQKLIKVNLIGTQENFYYEVMKEGKLFKEDNKVNGVDVVFGTYRTNITKHATREKR